MKQKTVKFSAATTSNALRKEKTRGTARNVRLSDDRTRNTAKLTYGNYTKTW